MQHLFDEIDRLRFLEKDWDSYGADPVDWRSIQKARNFLHALLKERSGSTFPVPLVGPTPSGGVIFMWYVGGESEVSVELLPETYEIDNIDASLEKILRYIYCEGDE